MADTATIDSYNKIAEEYHQRNAQTIWTEEYQMFKDFLKDKKDVVEIGCGAGRDAEELVKLGLTYTGIDASEGMLKLAEKRVPAGTFQVGDFFKLAFEDESFDGFWAAASFLHVPKIDIDLVLQEARRILKSNSIGFISVKEKTTMEEGVIKEAKAEGIQRYFAFYTQDEFESILKRNNFDIVQKVIVVERDPQAQRWLGFFVRPAKN